MSNVSLFKIIGNLNYHITIEKIPYLLMIKFIKRFLWNKIQRKIFFSLI